MSKILPSSAAGSASDINATQAEIRDQLAAIGSTLNQLTGNSDPNSGDALEALFTSPYQLYVNPVTGRDSYLYGISNSATTPAKLAQQSICGYSPFSPFKTIARACLEAARISIFPGIGNDLYDRVVIHVSAGEHIVDNAISDSQIQDWGLNLIDPSPEMLRAFNDSNDPGLILPRGVSIIGEDLRKTVIRPRYVPSVEGGFDPNVDRAAIFRITGGSFFYNFTFKDGKNANGSSIQTSHHLLSCFEFCGENDLETYYLAIQAAFRAPNADIVNPGETEIVGPVTPPTNATDTTKGASPYIFNCSIRSDYGLCGCYLDGNRVTGFKSVVTAQFTNVSLQKDLRAWQAYENGAWRPITSYDTFINNININDLRNTVSGVKNWQYGTYSVDWRSFGFKCVNNALIQEVSCFVIGDSVHHWTASGGECTITNSNSNFGATAFLSDGYRGVGSAGGALTQDQGFLMDRISLPLQIATDGSNIKEVILGTVAAYDPVLGVITLKENTDLNSILQPQGYSLDGSLSQDNFIWIANLSRLIGPGVVPGSIADSIAIDARAPLAAQAYDSKIPNKIAVKLGANNNLGTLLDPNYPDEIIGNSVYIRRLVDTRAADDRSYSLILRNTNLMSTRQPVGNYVMRLGLRNTASQQLDPTNGRDNIFLVTESSIADVPEQLDQTNYFKVIIRPGDSAPSVVDTIPYTRVGYPIFNQARIKRSKKTDIIGQYNDTDFVNSLQSLPDIIGVAHPRSGIAPKIVLDKDFSPLPDSKTSGVDNTLGINLQIDIDNINQQTTTVDYIAVSKLLEKIGYNPFNIGPTSTTPSFKSTILAPALSRELSYWNPKTSNLTPKGLITKAENWPIEFNRPSLIRGFGHAYEWVGYSNYSKALPVNQKTALTDQAKIDFLAVSLGGGRTYATGFTEEGLLVQGDTVRDLGTNRDLSIETAGLGGLSGDPTAAPPVPSELESLSIKQALSVEGVTTMKNVQINGTVSGVTKYTNLPIASQVQSGILRLATTVETQALADNTLAISPNTLAGIVSDTIKRVVNCRLSASKLTAVLDQDVSPTTSIYLHPFNGAELAVYDISLKRWRVIPFSGIVELPLTNCPKPNTTYDLYLNVQTTGTKDSIELTAVEWPNDTTPPARDRQDGVLVRKGLPGQRYMAVLRTTAGGTTEINLGALLNSSQADRFPKIYLANAYNEYAAKLIFFFATGWTTPSNTWSVAPPSVYSTPPRASFVLAQPRLVTAFLDMFGDQGSDTGSAYLSVAPGINNKVQPPSDATSGEKGADVAWGTVNSNWCRTLNSGFNEIFYLYKMFGVNKTYRVNGGTSHGLIVNILA